MTSFLAAFCLAALFVIALMTCTGHEPDPFKGRWPSFYDRCVLEMWGRDGVDQPLNAPAVGMMLMKSESLEKESVVLFSFEPVEAFCSELDARRRAR